MTDQDEIASQKIAELTRLASEKFSDAEINNFITMGKQIAGKSVLTAVIDVVAEGPPKGFSKKRAERLIRNIKKLIPYDYSGFVQCAFNEIPYTLNISLSRVDKNYRTDIDIPHESYAKDLFQQYDFLKNTAIAYWRQFVGENPDLYKKICDYRPDVDFNEISVDINNPTTMYFDINSSTRIGIFCYYVDNEGKPFYKHGKNLR